MRQKQWRVCLRQEVVAHLFRRTIDPVHEGSIWDALPGVRKKHLVSESSLNDMLCKRYPLIKPLTCVIDKSIILRGNARNARSFEKSIKTYDVAIVRCKVGQLSRTDLFNSTLRMSDVKCKNIRRHVTKTQYQKLYFFLYNLFIYCNNIFYFLYFDLKTTLRVFSLNHIITIINCFMIKKQTKNMLHS